MLNKLLIIIGFLINQNIAAQEEYKYLKPNLDDSCTIIKHILEEKNQQEYLIYLDRKYWSESKKVLSDFSSGEVSLKNMYPSYKNILKGRSQKLIPLTLPAKWIPLRQYKGELVLYCSNECNTRYYLTDSTVTMFEMGEANTMVIKKSSVINNHYHLTLFQPYNEDISELNISIINKERKIYLWEFSGKYGNNKKLFIPTESIPLFNIISTISYDAMIEVGNGITEEIDFEKYEK